MASIIEALENANYNLGNGPMGLLTAKVQLRNGIELLRKGYDIYTEVEPLLERWGSVDNVPDIDDNDEINQDD